MHSVITKIYIALLSPQSPTHTWMSEMSPCAYAAHSIIVVKRPRLACEYEHRLLAFLALQRCSNWGSVAEVRGNVLNIFINTV